MMWWSSRWRCTRIDEASPQRALNPGSMANFMAAAAAGHRLVSAGLRFRSRDGSGCSSTTDAAWRDSRTFWGYLEKLAVTDTCMMNMAMPKASDGPSWARPVRFCAPARAWREGVWARQIFNIISISVISRDFRDFRLDFNIIS